MPQHVPTVRLSGPQAPRGPESTGGRQGTNVWCCGSLSQEIGPPCTAGMFVYHIKWGTRDLLVHRAGGGGDLA